MSKAKPFTIERQRVMDAYLRVKANKCRGGVDEVSLEQFGKNYKNYLYKLWNQMSSSSYMAPLYCWLKYLRKMEVKDH